MNWLLAAHRSELAAPGDYITLQAGPDHIACFNLDGNVYSWDNVCRHRGARVLQGTHGNKALTCPYHGLTGMATVGEQYLTQWIGDFLFVGDGSTRIEDDLNDFGPLLTGISKMIAGRHSFEQLPMPCEWKVAVENTLEDYHVATVHADSIGKLRLKLDSTDQHGKNSGALYTIEDPHTVKGLEAMAKYFEEVRPSHYFHLFLYPYTCLSSVGGLTFSLQHYLPSGGYTNLHTRLYGAKTKPGAPDMRWLYDEATSFNRLVFEQDAAICARIVDDGTFLTASETRVQWFRDAHK